MLQQTFQSITVALGKLRLPHFIGLQEGPLQGVVVPMHKTHAKPMHTKVYYANHAEMHCSYKQCAAYLAAILHDEGSRCREGRDAIMSKGGKKEYKIG